MAKKGRKRVKRYFGPIEEEAVILFLATEDVNFRNEIYNKWLKLPFNKMVESIIRRYKLYRKQETFEDLHADTLSFIIIKSEKFEGARGKKAYSYYGTICKNYLMGLLIKDEKQLKQLTSYDDVYKSIEERDDMVYTIDESNSMLNEFIIEIRADIEEKIIFYEKELTEETINLEEKKLSLTDNEYKVGNALIDILDNWEVIFDTLEGGNKFNKNAFLATMRELTNLETKDVRLGMKEYKSLYNLIKTDYINDDLL